jgi:uncharacterized protein YjbI with pentapeptide repeats
VLVDASVQAANEASASVEKLSDGVAREQRNQASLEEYLNLMGGLLREGLCKSEEKNGIRSLARARTMMLLEELRTDGVRKGRVIQFMLASQLINKGSTVVSLSQANLEGIVLEGAGLVEANLAGANLRSANLRRANLTGADLTGTDLMKALR